MEELAVEIRGNSGAFYKVICSLFCFRLQVNASFIFCLFLIDTRHSLGQKEHNKKHDSAIHFCHASLPASGLTLDKKVEPNKSLVLGDKLLELCGIEVPYLFCFKLNKVLGHLALNYLTIQCVGNGETLFDSQDL